MPPVSGKFGGVSERRAGIYRRRKQQQSGLPQIIFHWRQLDHGIRYIELFLISGILLAAELCFAAQAAPGGSFKTVRRLLSADTSV